MLHKVAVVDEVKTLMASSTASIVSEYRGLTVAELAELRSALASVGGDYKIFKNTLVRRAIDGGDYQPLAEYLSGPTALTFVDGDVSAVAKALKDFARGNPLLVIKGGLADGSLLSPADLSALADLPSRDVLLARLAGALAAPMQQMAGLLQALPRNLAYGLSALIDQRQAGGETLPEAKPEADTPTAEVAEAPVAEDSVAEAQVAEAPVAEAQVAEAPVAEAPVTEAPVAEVPATEAETQVVADDTPVTEAEEAAPTESEPEAVPEVVAESEAEAAPEAEAEAVAEVAADEAPAE
jgi:large subunit ribosomal protein L10